MSTQKLVPPSSLTVGPNNTASDLLLDYLEMVPDIFKKRSLRGHSVKTLLFGPTVKEEGGTKFLSTQRALFLQIQK